MTLTIFSVLFIMLFLEIPIAISIGITSIVGAALSSTLKAGVVSHVMVNSLNSFPLLAVPFFILAGNLMSKGSMAEKLLNVSNVFFGKIRGSLAYTTILASAFFAALSGSGPATVAAIGGMMIPRMVEQGYRKEFAGTLAASSGILGPVIPPSIVMIVYGIAANESIADLFMAGLIPGILMAGALAIIVKINMNKWGHEIINANIREYSSKEKLAAIWDAKWALLMPLFVLGGIYSGIVTPTEAAIVAVVYAIFVGVFIDKDLNWNQLSSVFTDSVLTSGTVLIIVGAATAFGYILTMNQIPTRLAETIVGLTDNPILLILFINIFLIMVGCFMETLAAIIILTPILLPVAMAAGLSKIAFGVMLCVNLVIGQITPPVGVCLFVSSQISKLTIRDLTKYLWQFMIVLLAVLLLVSYVPQISEFLPNLLSK